VDCRGGRGGGDLLPIQRIKTMKKGFLYVLIDGTARYFGESLIDQKNFVYNNANPDGVPIEDFGTAFFSLRKITAKKAEKIIYKNLGVQEKVYGKKKKANPDDTEPDEEDCYIVDKTRGGYDVSGDGRFIGHCDTIEMVEKVLKAWQKKNKYYPNTWFIDDHGGRELYSL
jgi:hypothetical protein